MLPDLLRAREVVLLEQFGGGAEQEPCMGRSIGGGLGDRLDESPAEFGDMVKRSFECEAGQHPP